MMKIGGMLTLDLFEEKGFIIPFSVLARCSQTLVGKRVLDSKGRVIGKVTSVKVDRPSKEIYFYAEITKRLPKGGCITKVKGQVKDITMNKLKLIGVK